MGTSRPPGLKDVAEAAGVSVGLVSLALNGRPGVSSETRRRIQQIADALSYQADPHARALRTGSTSTVALVVRNLANPYFLDVITAAQQTAADRDATLLVVDSDYSAERERAHIQRLVAQRVGGLAVAPVGSGEVIKYWQDLAPDRPTVVLNATAPGLAVSHVGPDNEAAVRLAVDHLASLGHRRVTFLTAPPELIADHDRLAAFLACCESLGLDPDVVATRLTMAGVQTVVAELVRAPSSRPTAIITNSDFTAHAVYLAAREAGLVIGRDLSVVGHDDLPTSSLLDPPLTTLALDRRAVGRALARRLMGDQAGDHREPVRLVVRSSTGPA